MRYTFTDIECELNDDNDCLILRAFDKENDVQAEYNYSKEKLMEYYEEQFIEKYTKYAWRQPPEDYPTGHEYSLREWFDLWGLSKIQMWRLFGDIPADSLTIITE